MYKAKTNRKYSYDLSFGYSRNYEARKEKLAKKSTKGNYHVRISSKDIYGFVDHQENATYGLGYKLIKQREYDFHVLSHEDGTDTANFTSAGWVILKEKNW